VGVVDERSRRFTLHASGSEKRRPAMLARPILMGVNSLDHFKKDRIEMMTRSFADHPPVGYSPSSSDYSFMRFGKKAGALFVGY
jgi:hypothetical protein